MGRSRNRIRRSRLDLISNWEQRIKNADYSLIKLAKDLKTSPRHLRRYVQKTMRKRPHDWFTEIRLKDAPAERQQGKSVKEMADLARYKSRSQFSHAFKKFFGLPPSYNCSLGDGSRPRSPW